MMHTKEIIKAFGGVSKLSAHLRVDSQRIQQWINRDKIPEKYHADLIRLRRVLEIEVPIKDICK